MKCRVLALLLAALCCASCSEKENLNAPELLTPVAVKLDTAAAEVGSMIDVSLMEGAVVPFTVDVSFSISGVLKDIYVSAGDEVEKGDVLAELDQEAILSGIASLQETLRDIQTKSAFSDEQYLLKIDAARRSYELLKADGASETELAAKQLEIDRLQLDADYKRESFAITEKNLQNSIAVLRAQENSRVLTAPISGTVAYIAPAFQGDQIKEGSVVVSIADRSSLMITCDFISASDYSEIARCYARVGGKEYPLVYQEMERNLYLEKTLAGEEVKTTFLIEGDLSEVSCGDYASVYLVYKELEEVLFVPTNGVYSDTTGKYVYVVENDSRIRRDVEIGVQTDAKTEIISGLSEGEIIYVKK